MTINNKKENDEIYSLYFKIRLAQSYGFGLSVVPDFVHAILFILPVLNYVTMETPPPTHLMRNLRLRKRFRLLQFRLDCS